MKFQVRAAADAQEAAVVAVNAVQTKNKIVLYERLAKNAGLFF